MRHWTRILTMAAVGLATATAIWGGTEKLSSDLQGANVSGTMDVIVQYKQAPDAASQQRMSARGGRLKQGLGIISGGHYQIPATALTDLAADPDVVYVSPDRPVAAYLDQATAAIDAETAYQFSVNGSGVGIVLIDSGIGNHKDVNGAVVYQQSWTGDTTDHFGHGTHVAGILAGNGADSTGASFTRTFKGLATGASLISLKVLDSNGNGTDSNVIAAIETAIQLKNQYNIRVINLSLGRPIFESYTLDPLCQAVEQAWKAGIVVVTAAGNYGRANPTTTYGYGTITAPGNDPYVITVGAMNDRMTATRTDDVLASYSSKGPTLFDAIVKPDIVAPGNLIDSTLAPLSQMTTEYPITDIMMSWYMVSGGSTPSTTYLQLSGTSMATPFVSAAAALLIQQNPSMTPDQVKARLMKTAYKTFPATSSYTDPTTGIIYQEQYDIFTIGAGYLDVDAALSSTDLAPPGMSALSPAASFSSCGPAAVALPIAGPTPPAPAGPTPPAPAAPTTTVSVAASCKGNEVTLVNGTNVVWGSNVVWGANVVWGSNVVWGANVVWGSNVVWGASNLFLSATNVVWGSNVVWGANVVWGSNVVWGAAVTSGDAATVILTGDDQ